MPILIESFVRSLPALPLLLAALYLLSISAQSSARRLACQMLRLRIGLTLVMTVVSAMSVFAPFSG